MESSANVPSQHFFCISLNNGDLFMQRFCDGRLELVAQTSSVPFSSMVLCERDKGSGNFFVTGASLANGLMQINIRVAGTSPTVAPLGNSSKSTFVTDTTTVGESIYLCYGLGEAARLGTFEENIPLSIDYRSDPIFRGSTGIWMLKQYGMDRHHSMLAVSFVCSTILLQIELTGDSMTMTDLSEFYGIDTHRRTLAIENATNGSFLIQVCPNRVLVFKSNSSREQAGEVIAEWSPEHDESTPMVDTDISFSSAQIINDHTFALETRNRQFFIFQCKTGRGAASITKLTSFLIPAETTAFAIYPLHEAGSGSLSPRAAAVARSEYILACASLTSLTFWKIHIEENGQRIDELHTMPSSTSSPVNEMKFVRGPSREARLHLGCRDGSLLVMRVTSQDQQSIACEEIYIATVGKRPVQLVPLSLPKEQRAMLILSGGAMLLSEDEQFNLELVMPKADHLVRWVYQQSSGARREDGDDFSSEGCAGIRFVAIAHETLLIGHSTLKATRRIVPRQALPNARHLLVSGNYLICVASPFRSLLDSPMGMRGAALPPEVVVYHRSPSGGVEDEFILHRSVLAAGDLVMSACIVSNVGGSSGSINESTAVTIAIGMQVHSVGQLRILRLPNPVGASTAAQSTPGRRRHSIPPTQGQGALGSPSLAGGSCSSASANVASTPQMVSTGRSGAGGGPTQLIFACDAGFPHPVSAVAAVGPNSLLVAAGPEIHLVRLEGDSIKFVRTETWRSSIHALASNGRGIMAVASQRGGLELFQFKGDVENEDGLLVRLWGSALPDLVDRLLWCRVDLVAATDRRGMLHFLQLTGDKEPTIRKISHHLPSDIPMTMTLRPTGGDLLVATISGLIYEFPLPSADG